MCLLLFLYITFFYICTIKAENDITVHGTVNSKIPLIIQEFGSEKIPEECIQTLKKDIEFSQQCTVCIMPPVLQLNRRYIQELGKKGSPLALCICKRNKTILYGLYDTLQGTTISHSMINFEKPGIPFRLYAHAIADKMWPLLTGEPGCFCSKLAYCKELLVDGKICKHIFCADYDGTHEKLIVSGPTIYIAPSWNQDINNPMLLFSEYTNQNIALMALDMHGNKRVVSNFDGLNMQPCFSSDGTKVVYCASRGQGNTDVYYYDAQTFKRLTCNYANNICPTFGKDASCIYFCSDQTGVPNIYQYLLSTNQIIPLVSEYSVAPCFHMGKQRLAYIKRNCHIMQVWVYDVSRNSHTCLTTTSGNKDECCWSSCGNYIIYTIRQQGKSCLGRYSFITNTESIVINTTTNVSFPACSPSYTKFFG